MKLTSGRHQDSWGIYYECVTVHVWMNADGAQSNHRCDVRFVILHLITSKSVVVSVTLLSSRLLEMPED